MTPEDKKRLEICKKVLEENIEKGNYLSRRRRRETLKELERKLTEPVEPEKYNSEHFKTDNPFNL
jgi:hypothetical protein